MVHLRWQLKLSMGVLPGSLSLHNTGENDEGNLKILFCGYRALGHGNLGAARQRL
jgi:hypothetical protein